MDATMSFEHDPSIATPSPGRSTGSSDLLRENLKPPIDPPCRRSSLGFSKIVTTPAKSHTSDDEDVHSSGPSLSHNASVRVSRTTSALTTQHVRTTPQRVLDTKDSFDSTNAILHVDMHYAASPDGSIDSRLHSRSTLTTQKMQTCKLSEQSKNESAKRWRYSTIPPIFAGAMDDVREPVINDSPMLPATVSWHGSPPTPCREPPSSGHVSPLDEYMSEAKDGDDLPPLPPSSPPVIGYVDTSDPCLEHQMQELEVVSDSELADEANLLLIANPKHGQMDDSRYIFLSHSAKAAGDFARHKRGMLVDEHIPGKADLGEYNIAGQPHKVHQLSSADITSSGITRDDCHMFPPCPNPLAHINSQPAHPHLEYSHPPTTPHAHPTGSYFQYMAGPRITASGSPMPLVRMQTEHPVGGLRAQSHQGSERPIISGGIHPILRPPREATTTHRLPTMISEHFQPGWYYTNNSQTPRKDSKIYSFSTAAAKASGESTAPDSRIRDSYRTDTLTPLAKPPSRFRKNGIGAEIQQHHERRLHNTPAVVQKTRRHGVRLGEMPLLDSRPVRDFHGNPPKTSANYTVSQGTKRSRKRSLHSPDIEIMDDNSIRTSTSKDDGRAKVDSSTRAAMRRSIFGSEATETTQGTGDIFRELDPNVRIWRRGVGAAIHARKKRRPSYWDNELEEVKMSPVSRGGIASSPVMSKSSMVAELENVRRTSDDYQLSQYDAAQDLPVIRGQYAMCENSPNHTRQDDEMNVVGGEAGMSTIKRHYPIEDIDICDSKMSGRWRAESADI